MLDWVDEKLIIIDTHHLSRKQKFLSKCLLGNLTNETLMRRKWQSSMSAQDIIRPAYTRYIPEKCTSLWTPSGHEQPSNYMSIYMITSWQPLLRQPKTKKNKKIAISLLPQVWLTASALTNPNWLGAPRIYDNRALDPPRVCHSHEFAHHKPSGSDAQL